MRPTPSQLQGPRRYSSLVSGGISTQSMFSTKLGPRQTDLVVYFRPLVVTTGWVTWKTLYQDSKEMSPQGLSWRSVVESSALNAGCGFHPQSRA